MFANLNLLGKDHVSDLLTTAANVRSPAKHEFVANYTQGKVVNSKAVILPTHDLRGHVAWSSTGI